MGVFDRFIFSMAASLSSTSHSATMFALASAHAFVLLVPMPCT